MRALAMLGGLMLLFVLCGCQQTASVAPPVDAPTRAWATLWAGKPTDTGVVAAVNDFGFRLLDATRGDAANCFLSPLSVHLALSMTLNGAAGDTATAMTNALGLKGQALDTVNDSQAALLGTLLLADPAATLQIANATWPRTDFPIVPAFLERVGTYYNADVTPLDYTDTVKDADTINGWVSEHTGGKIPTLVEPKQLDGTVLVLANAIYFHGAWHTPFDHKNTAPHSFLCADGSKHDVPMMHLTDTVRYTETPAFQAVELPYGEGRMAGVVLLPKAGHTLDEVLGLLSGTAWQSLMGTLAAEKVDLALPRFTLAYTAGLVDPLTKLGMGVAFTDAADFSGLAEKPVCITDVVHKTYLNVNEEGTTAAAATGVIVGVTAVPISTQMLVDHPFLCAIRDTQTGALLFLGTVGDPG
jgi:serpin B